MDDETGPSRDSGDDLLDMGSQRQIPAWMQRAWRTFTEWVEGVPRTALAVALVLVTAGVVHTLDGGRPTTQPPAALPNDHPATVAPTEPPLTERDTVALATIRLLVAQPQLSTFIRSDSAAGECPLVQINYSPQRALAAAVHRSLPAFTAREFGRTLDVFSGLCTLQARARNQAGTVFVLTVVAPQSGAHPTGFQSLAVSSRIEGENVVLAANAIDLAGWTVTIGTIGPNSDRQDFFALARLAADPALTW